MALSNKGKIAINNVEYDISALKVNIKTLESKDSGRTDDGIYHHYYIFNRVREIEVSLPICDTETVSQIFNAISGKDYNLTYFDAIKGEITVRCNTSSTSGGMYSGVLLNGCWKGAKFKAIEIGGENV